MAMALKNPAWRSYQFPWEFHGISHVFFRTPKWLNQGWSALRGHPQGPVTHGAVDPTTHDVAEQSTTGSDQCTWRKGADAALTVWRGEKHRPWWLSDMKQVNLNVDEWGTSLENGDGNLAMSDTCLRWVMQQTSRPMISFYASYGYHVARIHQMIPMIMADMTEMLLVKNEKKTTLW